MTLDKLKGKAALVTGGARRLGRATALALAEHGVNVALHYSGSFEEAEKTCKKISSIGVKAWLFRADFSAPGAAEALMEEVFDKVGSLDILINSASVFPRGRLDSMTLDDLNMNVLVNAWSPFAMGRIFSERADRGGSIVNFLDTRIRGYDKAHAAYYLSKQMLFHLTALMAVEFAPKVTVNAVAPGLVLPPAGEPDDSIEGREERLPLKKRGKVEDVTDAVLYLLKSDFLTGQIIYVDGGRHIREGAHG